MKKILTIALIAGITLAISAASFAGSTSHLLSENKLSVEKETINSVSFVAPAVNFVSITSDFGIVENASSSFFEKTSSRGFLLKEMLPPAHDQNINKNEVALSRERLDKQDNIKLPPGYKTNNKKRVEPARDLSKKKNIKKE